MGKKKKAKIWQLILGLVIVVGGTVLFIGAVGGWFGQGKVTLDAEYYCERGCNGEMAELDEESYEKLIVDGKSFVVFVDQGGCKTADRVREFMKKYAEEEGVKAYRMMFEKARETSLRDSVKFYPSVAVISKGRVYRYLRADEDEDAEEYNDYEAFKEWMKSMVVENF